MKVYQLSDRADLYATSVANNGRRILESPKLKSGIAKTVIVKFPNGLQSVTYLDKFGKELISLTPAIEGDKYCDFPKIGKIEYDEF